MHTNSRQTYIDRTSLFSATIAQTRLHSAIQPQYVRGRHVLRILSQLANNKQQTDASTRARDMIRRGRAAGWLQLPPEAFTPWAKINDVVFKRAVPGIVQGRGAALLAGADLSNDDSAATLHELLSVPASLILSLERIEEHAKVDKDFREVLESLREFGRVGGYLVVSLVTLAKWTTFGCRASSLVHDNNQLMG